MNSISKQNPSIIVGMCTKNEKETIERTLKSILNQQYLPDKIVICDDSSDGTTSLIRSILAESDVPSQVVPQQRYTGPGGARQELFEVIAESHPDLDIFCTVDANICVSQNWLSEMVAFWSEHPEFDVLTAPDSSIMVCEEVESPHNPLYYRHAAMAIKFDHLKKLGGWDPGFDRGEDWDLAIRMYQHDTRVYSTSKWSTTYIGSDNTTNRKRISGNPTSIPYLAKYGVWYAQFHPAQLGKDIFSVQFYIVCAISIFSSIIFQRRLRLVGLPIIMMSTFIYAYNMYSSEERHPETEYWQPIWIILYTFPAMVRSMGKVIRGDFTQ